MSEREAPHGIVVGVDGSECSLAAVRWAACEARFRHVGLAIVHVIESDDDEADAMLAEAMAQGHDAAGGARLQIETRRVHGRPVQTLVDASRAAQLMVVGCRGQPGRRHLGSVGVGQLHHAHCPVVIVHDDTDVPRPAPGRRPVLVGIDGSRASLTAAAIAFQEASWRAADLLAMYVCEGSDVVPEREGEEFLGESLADLQQRYPEVVVHRLVRCRNPARALLVEAEGAQLVVVGSHGRGTFTGKLLGSVSAAVADQARVPVIVARRP